MGRRSYSNRRLTKHEREVMPSQFLLLLLGPFTCGLSWIGVIVLAFREGPPATRLKTTGPRKGLATGCDSYRTPKPPAETPEVVTPLSSAEPPVRSTAWAYSPRNLGGSHSVTTTQFRACKPD